MLYGVVKSPKRSDNTMANKEENKIMEEYQKELKKFFRGNSEKSFDEITTNMLEKMKETGKKVAEETQKEIEKEPKKKR